ncbi:histidinol-phosphate transaminase [Allokutzneria sp. A3M-2-11 16]|uniref:histidinol-phosphate transaminase n=1 Tax=Allokutzneria sp. A3M-2-11 16 TaxID=2962043 RepID=UPI0020B8228B|nr:histidinol-phosphate transaminase [Allokutzneria sp. A3M-2-11 16]MCP3799786.1 histidinol-phosphate transaminase [Allokutzneria sp. A3M-2-11 16]
MTVRTRPDLETLPGYQPGRTIPGAIKLASNEVSLDPLPSVRGVIAEVAAGVNRYPDMGVTALVDRLSAKFSVEPGRLAVGCGSVALCQQLVQAMCGPGEGVVFPWRSFEAYPIVTQIGAARAIKVPLTGAHALDLDAMLAAITEDTRLIFVCTPNNPTGTTLRRAELERFLDAVPRGPLIVLDEAYREFATDPDVPDGIELARDRDNVAVLRTFSKAYGLAGLRVGYCYAPEAVAEAMRKVCVPFSVNVIAQAAAIASLDAEDELMERCRMISGERDRVRGELLAMGYDVPETQANFVWLPLAERGSAFNAHCLEQKLVVRQFPEGIRVTISTPEENDLFLAAAKGFLAR